MVVMIRTVASKVCKIQSLVDNLHSTAALEDDSSGKASNLLLVLGVDVGEDSVLSRRNLLRELNILGQAHGTLLERTLQVHVLDVLAEIGFLVDDANETILDLKVHFGAFFDVLGEDTRSLDCESGATGTCLVSICSTHFL